MFGRGRRHGWRPAEGKEGKPSVFRNSGLNTETFRTRQAPLQGTANLGATASAADPYWLRTGGVEDWRIGGLVDWRIG